MIKTIIQSTFKFFVGRASAFKKCDVNGTLWSFNYTYQSCDADTKALLDSLVRLTNKLVLSYINKT